LKKINRDRWQRWRDLYLVISKVGLDLSLRKRRLELGYERACVLGVEYMGCIIREDASLLRTLLPTREETNR
jgi:hypothetical protein